MEITRVNVLNGPNVWTNYKALEAWVDIGKFEDSPSHTISGFPERIMAWLPSMVEHRCGIGERGGFFRRLVTGTYLGHILEHVTLELQSLAGMKTDFGRARETSERGIYKVAIEFVEPEVAIAAMWQARALILAAVEDTAFDVQAAVKEIRDTANRVCLGPGTSAIVKAAEERGIPALRLNSGSLVQLGYCSAQKRIWTAETDATSAVAESIAQDKQLTGGLLRAVGVPVPKGTTVDSPEKAIEFAESEGYPIVIKPRDGNHGRGVFVNLNDAAAIRLAYELASREGSAVVAEQMIPGIQHRVLVVGSRVVAVGRADPDRVIGDGVHDIQELVAIANQDPRRGGGGVYPLSLLVLDDIALCLLRQQAVAPHSVPASGQSVVLNYNGDCVTDVTDQIHPDVAEQCVLAAETVGLNIAGVDLIVENIGLPLSTQRGAVIEVNASPSLVMHVNPVHGTPQPVGAAVVSSLFAEGENGRVPVVAVTGANGKTTTLTLLEQILLAAGKRVGAADSDSLRANGRALIRRDSADFDGARNVLVNPFVDCALLEVSATSVLNQGLGFDQCQVAVVTNLGSGDHLGAKYIETLEVVTKAKRALVDVVLPTGTAVLNATDPIVAGLSSYCPGSTLYFSAFPSVACVMNLLNSGARVITIDRGNVVLRRGENSEFIVSASLMPHTMQGRHMAQVENALAAITAAYALGVHPKHIAAGLTQASEAVPPRLLQFELRGATVVLSLCRNLSALQATIRFMKLTNHSIRRKALYGIYADHGIEALHQQGVALGDYFHEVFCGYADEDPPVEQLLLDELVSAIQSPPRNCVPLRVSGQLAASDRLQSYLDDLKGGQQLLIQARNANTLERLSELVRSQGGTVADGRSLITAAFSDHETKSAQTSSNNP